jgi:hypothetical protein
MQNADWVTFFRQFPAEMHPQLVVVLNNRMEVSIETVFRVEPSYLMVRGRMGGTTDGGLLYMVPYSQMASVYLFRQIKEEEVDMVFGAPSSPNKALARSANGTERPVSQGASQSTPIPAFGKPPEATSVARNNLLERLRAARQAATPPPGPK